jgi:hypothetical protein
MSGVYNRKLFRQSGARDELRKMGGIMSSSEELMRAALMTGMQAPGPSDLGPMPMPQQPVIGMPAPPVMQPQQPMAEPQQPMDMGMQQPMGSGFGMQQPMDMGMQQPMDMGMQQPMGSGFGMQPSQPMMQQQPIQPPIAEPAYMPPTMPQSLQMEPAGFKEGGPIIVGAGSKFPRIVEGIGSADSSSIDVLGGIDIGQTAGTVVDAPNPASTLAVTAETLSTKLDRDPPETIGEGLAAAAAEDGVKTTGDLRTDLAGIYESLTGDSTAYEKNIDDLNRGIIGAAIAAGTSARATQNIANGMLVGLESAKLTEERRAEDARLLKIATIQAMAEKEKGSGGSGSQNYESPIDAYRAYLLSIENNGEDSYDLPEGTTFEEFAMEAALRKLATTYTPGQLVGTQFEGLHERLGSSNTGGAGGSAGASTPISQEEALEQARTALSQNKRRDIIVDMLLQMGIPQEVIDAELPEQGTP